MQALLKKFQRLLGQAKNRGLATSLAAGVLFSAQTSFANYQAAQAAFSKRDFATSAGLFFQAYGYPRNAAEKMKAEWGLAQSLQRLGFYYSSSKYYSLIVRRGASASNPFFRNALEQLGSVNSTVSLGQSHIVQLFNAKIDPAAVPGPARGFYFYYLGIESFNKQRFEEASNYFRRVPSGSPYYIRALFHLGVVSNLAGQHSEAIRYFEQVRSASAREQDNGDYLRELANMNIARVHYETKRYREALTFYGMIPRGSDMWLDAIFEASWAFFLMQNHNNALGNIHTLHSPFFDMRFYPESYILQAITYLRLCRNKEVKSSLVAFRARYRPVFQDLSSMLNSYEKNPRGFFRLVYDYRVGALTKFKNTWAILDSLSRTDVYKEAGNTIRFSDVEIARLSRMGGKWQSSGLIDELRNFLQKKKAVAVSDAGRRLFEKGMSSFAYLKELSDQTNLINTEMALNRVNEMREKLQVGAADKKGNFIGGMQELKIGQELEYWPFEGEYWEDELGGYVYNIDSKCVSEKGTPKSVDSGGK